jgi:hypothetical protein
MKPVFAAVVALIASAAVLTGCGPSQSDGSRSGQAASPTPAGTLRTVALQSGNCTLYTNAEAVALVGPINAQRLPTPILPGATLIDTCSYISLEFISPLRIHGFSYGVYEFASDQAAQNAAESAATQLYVDSASSCPTPSPFEVSGLPVGGLAKAGYCLKHTQNIDEDVAVVATRVGQYAMWVLAGTTDGRLRTQQLATTVLLGLVHKALGG